MSKASIAVVVPVHDDPQRLARCLHALEAQTVEPSVVVVVDDGSAPSRRPDVGGRRGVRLIEQANAGSYAARNAGIAATDSDVVAFTDADCLPAPDWLARGLAALEAADVVAGRIEVRSRRPRPGAVELFDAVTAFPQEQFVRRWGFGATANLLVPRAVLDAVGAFDARLRSGGDADWGERATAAGFRVVYAPDVLVRHPARATWGELVEKAVRTARGVEQLGRQRDEVTPLAEAVRRHLASPVVRLGEARTAQLSRPDLVRFTAVAHVAAALGAGEVVRGRAVAALRRRTGARAASTATAATPRSSS